VVALTAPTASRPPGTVGAYLKWNMKVKLKRKNFYLDQKKILRAKRILGAKTETEAIDSALDLVVFRGEIFKSLEKVAGKGGVERIL
jgi:hypothetical protein